MSGINFLLDLVGRGAILNNKRLTNENTVLLAGSFELGLVLVFALAGGIAFFVRKLGPARKRGFFVAGK
jgi:hypothetical protein